MRKLLSILLVVMMCGSQIVCAADADELDAATNDEPICSLIELQEAIEQASEGDIIEISQTITFDEELSIVGMPDKKVILRPTEDFQSESLFFFDPIDCSVLFQNLSIEGNSNLITAIKSAMIFEDTDCDTTIELQHVTISGFADRAIVLRFGKAKIVDCEFFNNQMQYSSGGQISIKENASVEIYDSKIHDNICCTSGAGISNSGNLRIFNSLIENNSSNDRKNGSHSSGGGIENTLSGKCYIENSTIVRNSASGSGGGIINDGDLECVDTVIAENSATYCGADLLGYASVKYSNDFSWGDRKPLGWYRDFEGNRFDANRNITECYGAELSGDIDGSDGRYIFVYADEIPDPIPSIPDEPAPPQPPQESDNSNDHDDTPSKSHKPSHGASAPSTTTNPAPVPKLQCGEAVIDSTRSAKLSGYGDGQLHLEDSLTRAQMAKIIYGLLAENCIEKIGKSDDGFKDVTAEAWFYTAVSALHNAGVVNGVGGGNYNPNDTVTWAQIIAVLSRFVDEEDCTLQIISYSGWAYNAIKTAVSLKWIEDQPNFDADAVISRGEFVELVNHVLNLYRV